MKINRVEKPLSSFLSVEKDMNLIMEKILNNERIKRLLYYTSPDCLEKENLTEEQTYDLIGTRIKNVPKLEVDNKYKVYLFINFDEFMTNVFNPEFRNNVIEFDIVCHFDQWTLKDFQMRPYKIAAEIDSMINNKHLTGIGTLKFLTGSRININQEFGGFCLRYLAIHGGEDKQPIPNPNDENRFLQDFEQMIQNSK